MHVVAETERENPVLRRIVVQREENARTSIRRRRQTVMHRTRIPVQRRTPVVLLDLQRPVAHGLVADRNVGRIDRLRHRQRIAADLGRTRLDAAELAVGKRLRARIRREVQLGVDAVGGLREAPERIRDARTELEGDGLRLQVGLLRLALLRRLRLREHARIRAVDPELELAVLADEVDDIRVLRRRRQHVPVADDVNALRLNGIARLKHLQVRTDVLVRAADLEPAIGQHDLVVLLLAEHGDAQVLVLRRELQRKVLRRTVLVGDDGLAELLDAVRLERNAGLLGDGNRDLLARRGDLGARKRLRKRLEGREMRRGRKLRHRLRRRGDDLGDCEVAVGGDGEVERRRSEAELHLADLRELTVRREIDLALRAIRLEEQTLPDPVGHKRLLPDARNRSRRHRHPERPLPIPEDKVEAARIVRRAIVQIKVEAEVKPPVLRERNGLHVEFKVLLRLHVQLGRAVPDRIVPDP